MTYFDQLHPWCIVRLLPHCQTVTVARFRRRNAALDYRQILRQLIPQGQFEVMFDAATLTVHRPSNSVQNAQCLESQVGQ